MGALHSGLSLITFNYFRGVVSSVSQDKRSNQESGAGYAGQRWLVEERDACGVGFIADQYGRKSHALIVQALAALSCMEHRGGCCADQDSGDGAGVMTAIPWEMLAPWLEAKGVTEPPEQMGLGMFFLPAETVAATIAREVVEQVCQTSGLKVLGWRVVPVNSEVLGVQAREYQPQIEQLMVQSTDAQGDDLDRLLYLVRKRTLTALAPLERAHPQLRDFYVCSFSCRTVVYKGMVRSAVLAAFYDDLRDPAYQSILQFIIAALAQTRCLSGRWRTRCGWWHTMAKLIPWWATSTGWWRGKQI